MCGSYSIDCCNNQREEGRNSISCECVEVTRSNVTTIQERKVWILSCVNVLDWLDRMLQQSERWRNALYLVWECGIDWLDRMLRQSEEGKLAFYLVWVCGMDSIECCNNQREGSKPWISSECGEMTRSNAATIRRREVSFLSRVSVWDWLDRMLQQSERRK
jgi:hypothetical protein